MVDEAPFVVGQRVRIVATEAEGVIVEVFRRHRSADVDLGDGVVAEMPWDELEPLPPDA
jgi:hypothetical protein